MCPRLNACRWLSMRDSLIFDADSISNFLTILKSNIAAFSIINDCEELFTFRFSERRLFPGNRVQACKEVIKRWSLFDFESAELTRFFCYVSRFFIHKRHHSSELGHPNLHPKTALRKNDIDR